MYKMREVIGLSKTDRPLTDLHSMAETFLFISPSYVKNVRTARYACVRKRRCQINMNESKCCYQTLQMDKLNWLGTLNDRNKE